MTDTSSKKRCFDVVLAEDETGAWIAEVPELRGCHTWGTTPAEALLNSREAIAAWLDVEVDDIEVRQAGSAVMPRDR